MVVVGMVGVASVVKVVLIASSSNVDNLQKVV
jgi:hypothetical protein